MTMMELLDTGKVVNLPSLMIQHIARVVDTSKPKHAFPFGFMLTDLFDKLNIFMPKLKFGYHNDVLYTITLR